MIGATAGHSKNADIAIPLQGNIFEHLFEIVMLLFGNANDLRAALFEIAQRFRGNRIKIADDGVAWNPQSPRMFRAAIGTDDEPRVLDCFERSPAERAAKNDESECVQAQGFLFTCMIRRRRSALMPMDATS